MKGAFHIFLFVLAAMVLQAQPMNFKWARQMGGMSSGWGGWGKSIVVDASGNVYTTGIFTTGTIDLDPGPGVFNLSTNAGEAMFVSKLNAAGEFVWAKQMSGNENTLTRGHSITVDAEGNVYTTGSFWGSGVDFDPGIGVFSLSASTEDVFVSKLDACGNFVWVKQMGGTINDHVVGYSINLDAAGNIYTVGYFDDFDGLDVDFDPGPGVYMLNSNGGVGQIFVSKMDASGNFVWAKQMEAIADEAGIWGSYALSSAIDSAGNIHITGTFGGTVDFDPGPGVFYLSTIYGDNFICKLDADGNFIWARQAGQTSQSFVSGNSIAVDASGNVYTTGFFQGIVDFDPGSGVFNLSGPDDFEVYRIFVSKLNTDGNFVWANQIGVIGRPLALETDYPPQLSSIALDVIGNVYITGAFTSTVDFDPGVAVFNMTARGRQDVFVNALDENGTFVWAKQMGAAGAAYGSSIVVDVKGNVYIAGAFSGAIDFDPGSGVYNLTSTGTIDPFIYKMTRCTSGNTSSTKTVFTCSSYTWSCQVYTSSGVYTQLLLNAAGCDSMVVLNLTIGNSSLTSTLNINTCNSYTWNGQTYTNSGIYRDTSITASGCDSIVTLELLIEPKSFSAINDSICQGQSYAGYTAGGTYIDTLVAANGCDSIRTLHLTLLTKPTPDLGADRIVCSGDTLLLCPGQFDNYLWQDGTTQNCMAIKQPGLYSVVVTNNCGTERDEILIKEGICDIYFPSAFTPNNDGKNDLFKILGANNLSHYHFLVYNRWGQKVFESKDYTKGWDGNFKGQVQQTGIYVWYCNFQKTSTSGNTAMKGTVLLIR